MQGKIRFCVVDGRRILTTLAIIILAVILAAVCLWLQGGGESGPATGSLHNAAPIYRGPDEKPLMSLTFNVDWGTEFIDPILDTLRRYGVKATFFLTGNWAGKFPEVAARIAADGNEIGNHGFTHCHPKSLSDDGLRRLIRDNEELLFKITGQRAKLFAPPYGEIDNRIARIAAVNGHRSIMWTIDTIDWRNPLPATIVDRVMRKAQNGAIVLMHPKANTVQALPFILEGLKERGFQLIPVGKLLEMGTP